MSDFYTKATFLDRARLYAEYYKIINNLSLNITSIESEKNRLSRFSGFGIETQVSNLSRYSRELRNLRENVRTEYQSLVSMIDTINDYEKKARNILHNSTFYERLKEITYEAMRTVSAVTIGGSRASMGLIEIAERFRQRSQTTDQGDSLESIGAKIAKNIGAAIVGTGISAEGLIKPTEIKGVSSFSSDKKESVGLSAEKKAKFEGQLGKVGVSVENELGSASAGVEVGKIKGEAYAKGSIGTNGVDLGIGGSVLVSAVSGYAKSTIGNSMLGTELDASGSLGNAELTGEANFTVKDGEVNIGAKGSAMVSAAQGSAKGTINILGLKITGTAKGYAGAAGVEGEIGIKDGVFKISGGAAALVGGNLGLEIGFDKEGISKFVENVSEISNDVSEFAKDVGKNIAETAKNVGKGVSEAAENIGKGVSKAANEVKKGVSNAAKNVGEGISHLLGWL